MRTNLEKTIKRLPRGLLKKIGLRFAKNTKNFDGENIGTPVFHKSTTRRSIKTPIPSNSRIDAQSKSSIAASIAASIMEEDVSSSPKEDDEIKDIKTIILSNLGHPKILRLMTSKEKLDKDGIKLIMKLIIHKKNRNNETIPDLKKIIKTIIYYKKDLNELNE